VDAIAEPARLHQQRSTFTAKPGACRKRDALLLRCERDIVDFVIATAALDQARVAGVGHIADLTNAATLERFKQLIRPVIGLRIHFSPASPSAGRSPSSSSSSFAGSA